jgi:hypothetical protein
MKARAILPGNQGHHAIQVYADEQSIPESVADFLADGLAAAQPTLVIATPAHCDVIVKELAARRFRVSTLLESGALLLLDAQEMLEQVTVEGRLDIARFKEIVRVAIERLMPSGVDPVIRVYGEFADVLWRRGNRDAALDLEATWNAMLETYSFSLMCGYRLDAFLTHPAHEQVCACHTHVHHPALIEPT